jgi:CRP/FNR family transcriptional regulator, cyclic AMP receptor protein
MKAKKTGKQPFDVELFLTTVNGGRSVSTYRPKKKVFSQGDPADSVFYIQDGKIKVCVISNGERKRSSLSTRTVTSLAKAA